MIIGGWEEEMSGDSWRVDKREVKKVQREALSL